MDAAARQVLKASKAEIHNNLLLEDSILDMLEQEDILTENMVHKVKAERTNAEKISQLLFMLPKRGPRAFETFVEAIRKHFSFLADSLEDSLNKELDKVDAVKANAAENKTENTRNSSDVSMETLSDRSSPDETPTSGQKDFTKANSLNRTMRSQASDRSFYASNVQQSLNSLYTKLKGHMTSSSLRELSFKSPEPVTFRMVDELVEDLLKSQNKCYSILGQKDKSSSLFSLIANLMDRNKHLEAELQNKEELRNKYAHHITKLESKCRDSGVQVKNMEKDKLKLSEQVQKMENDNKEMKTELTDMDEIQKITEREMQRLAEELEKRTYEYECRIQDLEMTIAQYAKELKKPVNMFVSGRSPFRDRWKNDPTPSQSVQCHDQYSIAVDVNLQRGTDLRMAETTLLSVQNNIDSKGKHSVTAGTDETDNGCRKERDRGTWKPKMTPHMTSIHPGISRVRHAGKGTPLEGMQITNGSCSIKPCMPTVSTASLSPRTKPTMGKTGRNGNFTRKH